jgi:hypothetical protein
MRDMRNRHGSIRWRWVGIVLAGALVLLPVRGSWASGAETVPIGCPHADAQATHSDDPTLPTGGLTYHPLASACCAPLLPAEALGALRSPRSVAAAWTRGVGNLEGLVLRPALPPPRA